MKIYFTLAFLISSIFPVVVSAAECSYINALDDIAMVEILRDAKLSTDEKIKVIDKTISQIRSNKKLKPDVKAACQVDIKNMLAAKKELQSQ